MQNLGDFNDRDNLATKHWLVCPKETKAVLLYIELYISPTSFGESKNAGHSVGQCVSNFIMPSVSKSFGEFIRLHLAQSLECVTQSVWAGFQETTSLTGFEALLLLLA